MDKAMIKEAVKQEIQSHIIQESNPMRVKDIIEDVVKRHLKNVQFDVEYDPRDDIFDVDVLDDDFLFSLPQLKKMKRKLGKHLMGTGYQVSITTGLVKGIHVHR